ncbi:MAG: tRNA (adenosine(37)-N6)-threonylcarbamoyltransferase complex ATPase subunit type 1 TsaE [Acidimicrobiales bacterium]
MSECAPPLVVVSRSAEETRSVGAAIASLLAPGDVVLLIGELGSGKTTLTKGVVEAVGGPGATSPTFTLSHRYETTPPITHVDCYRIEEGDDLADLALDEVLDDGSAVIIEWGERLRARFGSDALECTLTTEGSESDGADRRVITFVTHGPRWTNRLGELRTRVGLSVSGTSSARR